MVNLNMVADEWGTIIRAMKAVPDRERTPHWARAMTVLNEFLSGVAEIREKAGDPRKIDQPMCLMPGCKKPIGPGENFVFQPSDGQSFHSLCWLKERISPLVGGLVAMRADASLSVRSRPGEVPERLDDLLRRYRYLVPDELAERYPFLLHLPAGKKKP